MLSAAEFAAARAAAPEDLQAADTLVHDVLPVVSPSIPSFIIVGGDQFDLIEPLSDRELEVLRLLADGCTNQEIAEKLVLAIGTVKAHNHNIFSKLGVGNRVRAIARAKSLGLL